MQVHEFSNGKTCRFLADEDFHKWKDWGPEWKAICSTDFDNFDFLIGKIQVSSITEYAILIKDVKNRNATQLRWRGLFFGINGEIPDKGYSIFDLPENYVKEICEQTIDLLNWHRSYDLLTSHGWSLPNPGDWPAIQDAVCPGDNSLEFARSVAAAFPTRILP